METIGEQLLHKLNPKLHTSHSVERAKETTNAKIELKNKDINGTINISELISNKPAVKIANYLERFQDILNPSSLESYLNFDRKERNIEILKNMLYKDVVIKPDEVPESYFNTQKRLAREQGHGDIKISDKVKKQLTEIIIADQKSTLNNWINYLTHPDAFVYPMWAKYWAFNGMLKLSTYDKEKHIFGKRDKGTTAPFPDLDREALTYTINAVVKKAKGENIGVVQDNPELKKLLDETNFGKLYAYAIEKVTPTETSELTKTEGEWIKYDKNSNHISLINSLQGYATGWCTASEETAKTQLSNGDFYVYYSYDKQNKPTIPRVAIRMQNNKIAEVRGIAKEQNLDPYIGDIVTKKLDEFPDGKEYQKKSADMKRLTEIDNRFKETKELTKKDLKFLYEIDNYIQGFGYRKDPRIEEILKGRNLKKDLAFAFNCLTQQISTTKEEVLSGNIKLHYGDLDLKSLTSTESLHLPEIIRGNLNLGGLTSAEGLNLPEIINGDLNLERLTSAEGLHLPKIINGNLNLGGLTSAKGLNLPETVNGNLNLFNIASAKDLRLPKKVNGFLVLESLTSAEGLNLPEIINGDLDLFNLKSAKGLHLPEIIRGNLDLEGLTSAEGLYLPEIINGDLNLGGLTSAEGLNLPEIINGDLNLFNITSVEELHLPKKMNGNLNLKSLTSAKGLYFPETVNGYLHMSSLTSAEGLHLPKTVNGNLNIGSLTSDEKNKLRIKYPNLEIT